MHFVHISDTHLDHDPNFMVEHLDFTIYEGARALIAQINALPFTPDFVLHTGDVAYDPIPEAYETVRALFATLKYPIYYVAGNHDHKVALQRTLMGRDQTDIVTPLHYEFEARGVQVVCVDSNGPAEPPRGFMTDDQLAYLEQVCTPDDARPLVIAVHHNVLKVGVPWLDDFMGITNAEDFHQIVVKARQRLRGVFHGHTHQNMETLRDGVLYSGVLSSWRQYHACPGQEETIEDDQAEPGFNVVTITGEQTFIRRHRFAVPG